MTRKQQRSDAVCRGIWKRVKLKQNRGQQRTAIIKHICRVVDSKGLLKETMSSLLHQKKLAFNGNLSSVADRVCQLFQWPSSAEFCVHFSFSSTKCFLTNILHPILSSHSQTDATVMENVRRHCCMQNIQQPLCTFTGNYLKIQIFNVFHTFCLKAIQWWQNAIGLISKCKPHRMNSRLTCVSEIILRK